MVIEWQKQVIGMLMMLVFGQTAAGKSEKMTEKAYQKQTVDRLPIFERPLKAKIYDGSELIKTGCIKPVKRRSGQKVGTEVECPYCGSGHGYQYMNNGGKGQYLCKVCGSRYNVVP